MSETNLIAESLRAYLAERLGAAVRIVRDGEPREGLAIVVRSTHFGDPYAGGDYTDTLTFSADGLHLRFEASEHDLSGQCDSWTAEVRGAEPHERDVFRELFHPRQRRGHWGNHARIEYSFDGTKGEF